MNKYVKEILDQYPHLQEADIIQGKCFTNKGKVYLKYLHKQKDYWSSDEYFNRKDCVIFNVYCQDETMPTEIDKVLQYLDKKDTCEAYIVIPHENVWGDHAVTLFMPTELRVASAARDWNVHGGRWSDVWNKAMKIYLMGPMADMVKNNLITDSQLVQMIESDMEQQ